MIAKYKVVHSGSLYTLESEVNELISKGWKPQGGISTEVALSYSGKARGYVNNSDSIDINIELDGKGNGHVYQALIFEVDE